MLKLAAGMWRSETGSASLAASPSASGARTAAAVQPEASNPAPIVVRTRNGLIIHAKTTPPASHHSNLHSLNLSSPNMKFTSIHFNHGMFIICVLRLCFVVTTLGARCASPAGRRAYRCLREAARNCPCLGPRRLDRSPARTRRWHRGPSRNPRLGPRQSRQNVFYNPRKEYVTSQHSNLHS